MSKISNKWLISGIIVLSLLLISVIYIMSTQQDLQYEVIKIDHAPAAIYEVYELQKYKQGYSVNSYDNSSYILITMGEAPSGGYFIDVQDVYKSNDSLVIKTGFNEPKPNEMVITVITFPAIVIKVPNTNDPIIVQADGKEQIQLH